MIALIYSVPNTVSDTSSSLPPHEMGFSIFIWYLDKLKLGKEQRQDSSLGGSDVTARPSGANNNNT